MERGWGGVECGKKTAADKDATQTEVDNALNVLNAAVAKLEKVKDPNQRPAGSTTAGADKTG